MATAFRHLRPNWRTYIIYVEMAATEGDVQMKRALSAYLSLPDREQRELTPELLCELSNVAPNVLFGAVAGQVYKHSQQETAMILSVNAPLVAAKMAESALAETGGLRDREMFAKATGVLPTSHGQTINVNASPQIANVVPPNRLLGGMPQPIALPSPEAEILTLDSGDADDLD